MVEKAKKKGGVGLLYYFIYYMYTLVFVAAQARYTTEGFTAPFPHNNNNNVLLLYINILQRIHHGAVNIYVYYT